MPAMQPLQDFLASRGGPFYELQAHLHMLEADALRVRMRAAIFVAAAWGVPLVLGLPGSLSLRGGTSAYLLDPTVWARFFIAVAAFILAEEQVERGLRLKLTQFLRAPLLAPESNASAAAAVSAALKERDSRIAEMFALILAAAAGISAYLTTKEAVTSSWAVAHSVDGNTLTAAGLWAVSISVPLCVFLLARGVWRHVVWARLLRSVARLKLRLVATHPDGKGGLGFLAEYPNAYMLFVFGMGSFIASALAKNLVKETVSIGAFSAVMAGWLAIVILSFAYPLQAFSIPLRRLRERSLHLLGAEATRYHRAAERKVLGSNILMDNQVESDESPPDPTKSFETARRLSTVLASRSAIIPVTAAALVPFAIAGFAWLPYKEVLSVLKKLVLV